MGVWAPDLHTYSPYKALAQLGLAAAAIGGFAYLVSKTYPESPAVSVQIWKEESIVYPGQPLYKLIFIVYYRLDVHIPMTV